MRDPHLQTFVDATSAAFDAARKQHPLAAEFARKVFSAAKIECGPPLNDNPSSQVACDLLPEALDNAVAHGGAVAHVAESLRDLAPRLPWTTRPPGPHDQPDLADNHANARVIGGNGLEQRDDIIIGLSLVGPRTRYPDHAHPPEEAYLALSAGEWCNSETPWHAPGIGGLVHNPPGIVHAMRASDTPLLAVWCLWTAGTA